MLVVSAGLGKPVNMKCNFLQDRLCSDSRWTGEVQELLENEISINIKLHGFDMDWFKTVCPSEVCVPKHMLMCISIGGNVNMFVTPEKAIEFEVGVEHRILPIAEFFYDLLDFFL